jgi:hypothetical protein
MFSTVYQKGENGVEVFSPSGSGDPLKGTFSITNESSILKQYNRNIKGYCIEMESESATTKLLCPNSKHYSSLALTQPLFCLQLSLPSFPAKAFSLQLSTYDQNHQRKRFHFSTNFISQSVSNQVDSVLSVKLPWPSPQQCFREKDEEDVPDQEKWITYVLNLQELFSSAFPLSSFSSLDSFVLHPSCKLRKIFTLPLSAVSSSSSSSSVVNERGNVTVNIPSTFAFPSSGCQYTTHYYSLSSSSSSSSSTTTATSSLFKRDKGKASTMSCTDVGSDGGMMIAGKHLAVGNSTSQVDSSSGKGSSTTFTNTATRNSNKEKVAQSHRDKILASLKQKKLVAPSSTSSSSSSHQKTKNEDTEETNQDQEMQESERIIVAKPSSEKISITAKDSHNSEEEKTVISPRDQTKQIDLSLSKKILRAVNEKISTQKDDSKDKSISEETMKSQVFPNVSVISSSSPTRTEKHTQIEESLEQSCKSENQGASKEESPVPPSVHDYIKAEIDWIYGKKSLSPRVSASFPFSQQPRGSESVPPVAVHESSTPLPIVFSKEKGPIDVEANFEHKRSIPESIPGSFTDALSKSQIRTEQSEILAPYSPHQPMVSVENGFPVSQSSVHNSLSRSVLLPYHPIIDKRIREVKRFYESTMEEKAKTLIISAEEKDRRISKFNLLLSSLKSLEVAFVADYGVDEYNLLVGEFVVE